MDKWCFEGTCRHVWGEVLGVQPTSHLEREIGRTLQRSCLPTFGLKYREIGSKCKTSRIRWKTSSYKRRSRHDKVLLHPLIGLLSMRFLTTCMVELVKLMGCLSVWIRIWRGWDFEWLWGSCHFYCYPFISTQYGMLESSSTRSSEQECEQEEEEAHCRGFSYCRCNQVWFWWSA